VLLLDMSWSMSWEGFSPPPSASLALESHRAKFPRDYFTRSSLLHARRRAEAPRPAEASWNMGDPFTNLQDSSAWRRAAREAPE
jgi:hypothetical protein